MRHLIIVLALLTVLTCASEGYASEHKFAFVYVPDGSIQLPRCPAGCQVRGFRKFAFFVTTSPAEILKQPILWRTFFHDMGLSFPKGGFVVYDRTTDVCFVATIAAELDLIEYHCHVP